MRPVRIQWLVSAMVAGLLLFPPGWAYTEDDSDRLINEADELVTNARSEGEIKSALKKYGLVAENLRKVGSERDLGGVFIKIGRIHCEWAEYQKADTGFKEGLVCARVAKDVSLEADIFNAFGLMHIYRGELREAEDVLKKSLEIARQTRDPKIEADALYHLASVYRLSGASEAAMRNAQKSIQIYQSLHDKRGEARSLTISGWLLFWSGKSSEAKDHYDRALALALSSGDASTEVWIRLRLSELHSQLGKTSPAMEEATKALQISQALGSARLQGYALNSLGLVYGAKGEYDSAVDSYRKALPIAEKIEDKALQAHIIGNEGLVWRNRNQHDKSMKLSEKSLEISRKIPLPWSEANQLHNLAMDYANAKQYSKAIDYYQQALKIRQKLNDTRYAVNHINGMGLVFMDTGRLDEAARYFEEALRLARSVGNRQTEGWALNNLGEIARRNGQYGTAIDRFQEALALAREIQYSRLEEFALTNMTKTYMTLGNTGKVTSLFNELHAAKKRTNDAVGSTAALNSEAMAYMASGQYPKARQSYEKALKIAQAGKDAQGESASLLGLGMISMVAGKYKESADYYEKAYSLAGKDADLRDQATILVGLFGVYSVTGHHTKAGDAYTKLMQLEPKLEDPQSRAALLGALTMVSANLGVRGKANDLSGKLLELTENIKDPQAKVNLLLALSQTNADMSRYDKAAELTEKAVEIAVGTKYAVGQMMAFNQLGRIREDTGRYGKAAEAYNESLKVADRVKDPKFKLMALTRLGVLYHWWGRYNDSLSNYEEALNISRKISDHSAEALCSNYMGEVHKSIGDYDAALKCFQAAMKIARTNNDPRTESTSLIAEGEVLECRRAHDEAIATLVKAISLRKQLKVSTGYANSVLCHLYLNIGNLEEAERYVKEANSRPTLGRLYLLRGNYTKAKEVYGELAASAQRSYDTDNLFVAYTALGLCSEGLGDLTSAADNFRKAVDLTEELRSSLAPEQREKFFDVRVNGFYRTAPYEGLARVLTRLNRPSEGWTVIEYTKARVFSEAISRNLHYLKSDAPDDIVKADLAFSAQVAGLKQKRREAIEKDDQPLVKYLEPQISALTENFIAHVKRIRDEHPLFAANRYPEPMDLSQSALKNGEWVLSYDVTDPGVLVYLTNGKNIVKAFFKPIPREDLDNLVLRIRRPLDIVPDRDNFDEKLKSFDLASGKRLADLLLSDILDSLPTQVPVVVVPDDSLGVLPFEMLVLNDTATIKTDKDLPYVSGAEFFGDRNRISYSQSITALTLSRIHTKAKGSAGGLIAIADPVFDEKDERVARASKKQAPTGPLAALCKYLGLMAAEKDGLMGCLKFSRLKLTGELAQILSAMGENNTKIYTGFEATKDNFLRHIGPSLNRYNKVVFATHGYFGKDLPGIMEPVLVLTLIPQGTDGYLRMSDVMGLNMNADVVALTACQTGLGKRIAGEGTMGMGRAFQYAGARSVLMSLWSVSELTSVRLVSSFFQHMKERKSKSEALALAREEIRKSGFDHPFFWAGFILVGEKD